MLSVCVGASKNGAASVWPFGSHSSCGAALSVSLGTSSITHNAPAVQGRWKCGNLKRGAELCVRVSVLGAVGGFKTKRKFDLGCQQSEVKTYSCSNHGNRQVYFLSVSRCCICC